MGLPTPAGAHFHEKLYHLIESLGAFHPATSALAVLSLALAIYGPRIPGLGRVPGPWIAMVVATAIQAAEGFPGVATIASAFGGIPQGLAHLSFPDVTSNRLV